MNKTQRRLGEIESRARGKYSFIGRRGKPQTNISIIIGKQFVSLLNLKNARQGNSILARPRIQFPAHISTLGDRDFFFVLSSIRARGVEENRITASRGRAYTRITVSYMQMSSRVCTCVGPLSLVVGWPPP